MMIKMDGEKSAGVKFNEIKARLMEDAEFANEYNNIKSKYELLSQNIEARKSNKTTQKEVAQRAE